MAKQQGDMSEKKRRRSEFAEVWYSYFALFFAVLLTAQLIPAPVKEYAYSVILAAMVYLPVFRSEKHGFSLKRYGIHLQNWHKDLGLAVFWMLIIFPLFALGNHLYRTVLHDASFQFAWLEVNLAYLALEQTLFIALPEEFFYRGWMLSVFQAKWPTKWKILGGDFGKAVFITSALFAVGHLASVMSPFRLAVFFPSLLFSWLRLKTGGLFAPILVHGLSNVLIAHLNAWYG